MRTHADPHNVFRLLLAGLLCLSAALLARCAPAGPRNDTVEGQARAIEEVLRLVNFERAKVGLPPYQPDPNYAEAAQIRADQIIETEHYSHYDLDGRLLVVPVLSAYGLGSDGFNEILTISGDPDPVAGAVVAVRSWMESERHRPVVLSDELELAGVGVAWSHSGMDFDPGPGSNFGVGAAYVLIAGKEKPSVVIVEYTYY